MNDLEAAKIEAAQKRIKDFAMTPAKEPLSACMSGTTLKQLRPDLASTAQDNVLYFVGNGKIVEIEDEEPKE